MHCLYDSFCSSLHNGQAARPSLGCRKTLVAAKGCWEISQQPLIWRRAFLSLRACLHLLVWQKEVKAASPPHDTFSTHSRVLALRNMCVGACAGTTNAQRPKTNFNCYLKLVRRPNSNCMCCSGHLQSYSTCMGSIAGISDLKHAVIDRYKSLIVDH